MSVTIKQRSQMSLKRVGTSMMLIGALVLAACGTDDNESAPETAEEEPVAGEEPTDVSDLDALIEAAQAEGHLVYYSGETEDVNNAVTDLWVSRHKC
ncbi:MAG: hypothetical protein GEU90_20390 [Gemmatimonas sp.]|nr:hypothetical protein [Gemmatimonas sp.]